MNIQQHNARYEQQVERLLQDMGRHNDETLNQKPVNGGWSVLQTMHHLILSEEGSLAYAQKKMNAPAHSLGKAGLGSFGRSTLLWLSLSSPFKFRAPKAIDTEFLPERSTFAETATRWRAIREKWRMFFDALPAEYTHRTVYKHPRAGRLSWTGLVSFFSTHQKRHKKQMERALVARA